MANESVTTFRRLNDRAEACGLGRVEIVPHPFKEGQVCVICGDNRFSGDTIEDALNRCAWYICGFEDGKKGGSVCGRSDSVQ